VGPILIDDTTHQNRTPPAVLDSARWLVWLPLLLAAAYVTVLAATLGSVVRALYSSADVAAAPYIGQLLAASPGGAQVILGHVAWYEVLWVEWLTRGWPLHRQLWEVGPWFVSLAGVGLVAWATAKAAGRFAATIVVVTLGCAGAGLISYQFAAAIHSVTWVHVCLLGAFLVLVAGRDRVHPALWVGVTVVTAVGVASDELLVVAGLVPFVLAAAALGRGVFVRSALLAGVSVAGGSAIGAAMAEAHVRPQAFPIGFGGWHRLESNARILAGSLLYLFNGVGQRSPVDARSLLGYACSLVLAAAAVFAAWSVLRPTASGRVGSVHKRYWALVAVLLSATFVATNVPIDRFSARYVLAVGYAIAVLAAVAAAERGRLSRGLVTIGACVIVCGSIVAIAARDLQRLSRSYPSSALAARLLDFAQTEHVREGYAGYWDAAPLTWETNARLRVYPIEQCPAGTRICPFPYNRISSWYTPEASARTFLVLDPARPAGLISELARLGLPERRTRVGRLTVYIYSYDIASRFGA
jgi:hypothetical protein